MTHRGITLFLAAGLLACAVAAVAWSALGQPAAKPWQPLSDRFPREIQGWEGRDLPLGETEAVEKGVAMLNYQDYVYRSYRKNGVEIFVYAMYWKQGSLSVREVAGHTPDGCWVAAGARPVGAPATAELKVGPRQTGPAECRLFSYAGHATLQVAWWHLWGGRLVERGYADKSVLPMLKETWEWLGRRRGSRADQLFVRIHSSVPLESVLQTQPVQTFLNSIPEVFDARAEQ